MQSQRAVIALLALLSLYGLAVLWLTGRQSVGIDFYQMWLGGRAAAGTPDFYTPAARERIAAEYLERARTDEHSPRRMTVARYREKLETVSTPFLYTFFGLFRGTYEGSLLAFQILMFVTLAAALFVLARVNAYPTIQFVALTAFLLNAYDPIKSDIRVVNLNFAMLLLVVCTIALTVKQRHAAAGSVLAIATLLKPYTGLIFVCLYAFWILHKRWRDLARHAAGAGVTAAVAIGVSSAYFGTPSIWLAWFQDFRALPSEVISLNAGNFALKPLTVELTGYDLASAVFAVAAAATLYGFWKCRTLAHGDRLAIALGCVLFQLVSPLVWIHHLILSLPLTAHLLRPGDDGESARDAAIRQGAGVCVLALTMVELWMALLPSLLQVAALTNVGLLIACAAGLRDLRVRHS